VPTLPYEYIICLLLALCPPVWFHVADPKVDAVFRAQNGIKVDGEEDAWNLTMQPSKADKKRDLVAKSYIAGLTLVLSYLTFSNGI